MPLSFTLGMPLYENPNDPHQTESVRAIFTAQSALIHHQPYVKEVVIVDNNPLGTVEDHNGKPIPKSCLPGFCAATGQQVRYVPYPEPQGTMPAKNKVFEEAQCEYVCCVDAHELLYPDFFKHLSEFFESGQCCQHDLVQGPLMTERLGVIYGTHFNNQWRGQMWGTWGRCWIAPNGLLFSCIHQEPNELRYVNMPQDGSWPQRVLTKQEIKEAGLPYPVHYFGHETKLMRARCRYYEEPFQITGMGMGMFACRNDAWLPFHPDARGFGAEEMTTHLRFLQAGRRCWCLPKVQWWHHFERCGTRGSGFHSPYPVTLWDKVRNYVLEFKRLGLDLGPIRRHFDWRIMGDWDWQQILSGVDWPSNEGNPSHIHVGESRQAVKAAGYRSGVPLQPRLP